MQQNSKLVFYWTADIVFQQGATAAAHLIGRDINYALGFP